MTDDKAHLIVLSGVFYMDDADLMVADEENGAVRISDALSEVKGKLVSFVAHHCPPDPPDESRWGGGSCLLERTGYCPAGHHERPRWLYEHSATGRLEESESGWWLTKPGGERVQVVLSLLVGHHGQVVVTALPDIESLQGEVQEEMKNPTIEGIQDKIEKMRNLLRMVNQEKDDL